MIVKRGIGRGNRWDRETSRPGFGYIKVHQILSTSLSLTSLPLSSNSPLQPCKTSKQSRRNHVLTCTHPEMARLRQGSSPTSRTAQDVFASSSHSNQAFSSSIPEHNETGDQDDPQARKPPAQADDCERTRIDRCLPSDPVACRSQQPTMACLPRYV